MGLFRKKKRSKLSADDAAALALRSLDFIAEAVLVVDENGMIKFANPAAAAMTGYSDPDNLTGLDYQLIIHLEDDKENPVDPNQSTLYTAIHLNQSLHTRQYILVAAQGERKIAIDLSLIPTGDQRADRIVTFRDITKELAEEKEQAEFISTASHEMRTPVASIEGYLGLCLNPQTATIDERAKKYLEAAHSASQHLGHLFKDLLDVTKLDDNRADAHLVPVDAVEAVSYIANEQAETMQQKNIRYIFGESKYTDKKRLTQKIYMAVDYDFLHEIVDNLVGNAIKYTPEGGEIKVNVKGDGDKVIISVADNGIGIPAEDLGHIFQKFYRVDNRQTREIGGTGLGLYLVKQRAENMGGRVWAESDYGHGSVFYVSLPRISESEYEKMRIAYGNEKMMRTPFVAPVVGTAEPKIPAAGVSRTVTGASTAKIVQPQAVIPQAVPQAQQVAATEPAAAEVQPTANSVAPAAPQIQRSATVTPMTTATTSSMISTHGMALPPEPMEDGDNVTEEEPQIFARKGPTLQPTGVAQPANQPVRAPMPTATASQPPAPPSSLQPSNPNQPINNQ